MNNEIKERIKSSCVVPNSKRKDSFLKEHRKTEISMKNLYMIQVSYIDSSIWIYSAVIAIILLLVSVYAKSYAVWVTSAFMPILATISITENHKSEIYQMNELEMSARFSLKTVVMIRMSIFGIVHSIILIMLSLLSSLSTMNLLVYLLVPYLITSNTNSVLLRHYHGKSALLWCLANSFIMSMMWFILSMKSYQLYSAVMFPYWIVMLIIMAFLGILNTIIMLKRTECFYGFSN